MCVRALQALKKITGVAAHRTRHMYNLVMSLRNMYVYTYIYIYIYFYYEYRVMPDNIYLTYTKMFNIYVYIVICVQKGIGTNIL